MRARLVVSLTALRDCREVDRDSPGDGLCETNDCLLKALHMLAACPEFWPNVTSIGPNTWAEPSRQCTADCAEHFIDYYEDRCWVWLDEALFCDGFGGAPFLADCPPKSAMRMDSNRFADECRALTESWIESTWFFTLVVAVTCAVVGFGTMKLIRKQEKAKSGPGRTESDVTDLRSSFGGRKSNQAAELR